VLLSQIFHTLSILVFIYNNNNCESKKEEKECLPMHWPKRVLGNLPSTAKSRKRFSTCDQPSVPTFLVMNLKPRRARAAPDLDLSTLSNFLDEVILLSSCETCRSRTDSEEGRFSRREARSAVSGSPPLMFWTETTSSRTSSVISTNSSSSLNLALFLLLFLLETNGPLMGPLKPTRVLRLPELPVSDHDSIWCSSISITSKSLQLTLLLTKRNLFKTAYLYLYQGLMKLCYETKIVFGKIYIGNEREEVVSDAERQNNAWRVREKSKMEGTMIKNQKLHVDNYFRVWAR